MLDTHFPRVVGDIGNPATFGFEVSYLTVRGATPERVVRRPERALLAPFIAAGKELVCAGASAIATSCGFLIRFQQELQSALPVPVWSSSLLLVPEVQSSLPEGKVVGVLTVDALALGAEHLRAAGAASGTPVEGLATGCPFQRTLLNDEAELDVAEARQSTVAAALKLMASHPEVGAIVLECTNMPPYADAVRAATGVPVHDITTLIASRFGRGGSQR
ncbi:MAG: aspartate/glutamate racemase family protein [Burkholderiaceae bacterium]|nr:aspartate/glutamate racemase family protein [Burkholderiaceae bacterium]